MSYEVWGEPEEIPECPYCQENAEEKYISDKHELLGSPLKSYEIGEEL